MNSQEKQAKYEWMADIWGKAAAGGEFQNMVKGVDWIVTEEGPPNADHREFWRIKPELKAIDLTPLIESGLDCEFWDDSAMPFRVFKLWDIVEREGTRYLDTDGAVYWKNCQPRMKHIHYWAGESAKCPIPEGFEVRLYFRDGTSHILKGGVYRWTHTGGRADIIGVEFIAVKEGYTLTPTC